MPTEAEAGGVLVKLAREQTTKEQKNRDRSLVSIEVAKAAMGLRKICHPKEMVSRAVFTQHPCLSKPLLLSRESCKFPHQCLN